MKILDRCVIAPRLFRMYRHNGQPIKTAASRAWRMSQ